MASKKKLANQKSRTELRTQIDVKGIKLETKAKLKLMAANEGVFVYQLLDRIVEEAFEKEGYTLVKPGVAGKILKEVRKLLRAHVRALNSRRQ